MGALTTHVDDLAIVGKPAFVDTVIASLGKTFTIGANDDLHHFLSLQIERDCPNRLLFLNQTHYIDDLCSRFLDGHCTTVQTPTSSDFKNIQRKTPGEATSPGPYNFLNICETPPKLTGWRLSGFSTTWFQPNIYVSVLGETWK